MDYHLTPDQIDLQLMTRDFADKELVPIAAEYDLKSEFPMEAFQKAVTMGLTCLDLPEEWGGAGVDLLDRGAGHLHEIAALFLGESLFVDEADGLVLIHRQDNCLFSVFMVFRQKCQCLGVITHAPAFLWPWHRGRLLSAHGFIKAV